MYSHSRWIPETVPWLYANNRVDEAEDVIRKAAKMNNVVMPDVIFERKNEISGNCGSGNDVGCGDGNCGDNCGGNDGWDAKSLSIVNDNNEKDEGIWGDNEKHSYINDGYNCDKKEDTKHTINISDIVDDDSDINKPKKDLEIYSIKIENCENFNIVIEKPEPSKINISIIDKFKRMLFSYRSDNLDSSKKQECAEVQRNNSEVTNLFQFKVDLFDL